MSTPPAAVGLSLSDMFNIASAVGTILMAIATGVLAWFTYKLAQETRQGIDETRKGLEQDDRHHQENLRPLCFITFQEADRDRPFGKQFAPRPAFHGIPERPHISILGELENKGLGPAKDVCVYLNTGSSLNGTAYWLTRPIVVCSLIRPGEKWPIGNAIAQRHIMPVVNNDKWISTYDLASIANDTYEVVIEYRDMFENFFRTVHPKGFQQNIRAELAALSGDRTRQEELVLQPDKPTPIFLKGRQAWRTLADAPAQPPPLFDDDDMEPAEDAI